MTLSASIKHKAPGRMRLQVVGNNFDKAALRATVLALQNTTSLRRIECNPLTRTILLEAESEELLQSALKDVADARVIQLKTEVEIPAEEPESLRASWAKFCKKSDNFLKKTSDGRVDLRAGMALGLTALGLSQMTRGKFLPAGLTLLMYAIGVMDQGQESKEKK